eukprot:Lithocolla_globosa_v1_NODE_1277_length_2704_cov_14.367308.p1 type:complete len:396 gc:universal NODE_1277_length_2704_cov_14.367308:894-2081(+)
MNITGGDDCSPDEQHQATVIWICDETQNNGRPMFTFSNPSGCHHHFEWKSASACKMNYRPLFPSTECAASQVFTGALCDGSTPQFVQEGCFYLDDCKGVYCNIFDTNDGFLAHIVVTSSLCSPEVYGKISTSEGVVVSTAYSSRTSFNVYSDFLSLHVSSIRKLGSANSFILKYSIQQDFQIPLGTFVVGVKDCRWTELHCHLGFIIYCVSLLCLLCGYGCYKLYIYYTRTNAKIDNSKSSMETSLLPPPINEDRQEPKNYDIFVAYRVASEAMLAERLVDKLQQLTLSNGGKITCFLDKYCLTTGSDFSDQLLTAVKSSCLFLPLTSEPLVKNLIDLPENGHDNVLWEYETALKLHSKDELDITPLFIGKMENRAYFWYAISRGSYLHKPSSNC